MMQIQVAAREKHTWVTLAGKMWSPKDLAVLEQSIISFRDDQQIQGVVLDFYGITFISSHGLGFLVKICDILRKNGKKLVLFNPREEIKDIIELSAVNRIVPVIEKRDEVDKAFS